MMYDKNIPLWVKKAAGRIPECLHRVSLGDECIQELLSLLDDDGIHFKLDAHLPYGWKGIYSHDGGDPRDEDEAFIVEYMLKHGIDTLYATSASELHSAKNGFSLVAKIEFPTISDWGALRSGGWCIGEYAEYLQTIDLLWDNWREQLCFTLPLQFAMVRLIDGYGHTTILGPVELTEGLKGIPPSDEFPHDPPWEDWPIK